MGLTLHGSARPVVVWFRDDLRLADKLPGAAVHRPWRAAAGYPAPIVDLDRARRRALETFAQTLGKASRAAAAPG